ncbi:MAG: Ig-like domain-containing protein [Dehalococcoidia bacterium]
MVMKPLPRTLGPGAAGLIGVIGVVVLVITVLLLSRADGGDERPEETTAPPAIELQASDENEAGIAPGSTFALKSDVALSADSIKAQLKTSPEIAYSVNVVAPGEAVLTPDAPLAEDRVYRFEFVSSSGLLISSWAFQVRPEFRVTGSLPAHQSTQVPIDTGIEISFNLDGVVRAEDFVQITPAAEGHFEQHKRTLVFVPRELQPETIYTVSVAPGVTAAGGALLSEPYTFAFETGTNRRGQPGSPVRWTGFMQLMGEATPQEPPAVTLYSDQGALDAVDVQVFSYPTLDAFITDWDRVDRQPSWALSARRRTLADTSVLPLAMSFKAPVEGASPSGLPYGAAQYFRFPDRLPEGYYLIQLSLPAGPAQMWLQVTSVSAYVALTETDTLVWANDLASGNPLANATVSDGSNRVGSTDAQGIARFVSPDGLFDRYTEPYGSQSISGRGHLLVEDGRGRRLVVPLSPVLQRYSSNGPAFIESSSIYAGDDYWRYMTTDRFAYTPNDVVRFWGVARLRDGGAVNLKAGIRSNDDAYGTRVGSDVAIDVDDFGTFSGEFPLPGLKAGYYTIEVSDGDTSVTAAYFMVSQYEKPAYRITAEPSRRVAFAGEQVTIEMTAEFYDGTPAPGVQLTYNGGKDPRGEVVTDTNGRASIQFTAMAEDDRMSESRFSIAAAGMEQGEVSTDVTVAILPGATATVAEATYENNQIVLTGTAYNVDRDVMERDIEQRGTNPYFSSSRGSVPAGYTAVIPGQSVEIAIEETVYDRVEVGERYDFINKVSRKIYRYDRRVASVSNLTISADANGRFRYSFPANESSSYQIGVLTRDANGRATRTTTGAYGGPSFSGLGDLTYLSVNGSASYYYSTSEPLSIGESVNLRMMRGDSLLPSNRGSYLFFAGTRGLVDYHVQNSPSIDLKFSDAYVPSATIRGVYFTGSTYVETRYGAALRFDSEDRRLNIELEPEQATYRPGDEAVVQIRVTDKDGKPVRAEVNVAAVDEAAIAAFEWGYQQSPILEQLYTPVRSGFVRTYGSHQLPPDLGDIGGRGGGGGPRTDFVDVAYFGSVRTGANGTAEVKFKLPDNLTSWRLTAHAVTEDLRAGQTMGSLAVGLPFFVNANLNESYLATDNAKVLVRGFGTQLKAGDAVKFSIEVTGRGTAVSTTGRAFEPVALALPDLPAGDYDVVISAESGSQSDAIRKTVSIVESRQTGEALDFITEVTDKTRFSAGSSTDAVRVTFAEAGQGRFYHALLSAIYGYGDRADQATGRVVAARLLKTYFNEDFPVPDFRPAAYLKDARFGPGVPSSDAGVALLPYGDSDLALTAQMAVLAPDLFGRSALESAFQRILSNPGETPERQAIALYGLAGLDVPVLQQARAVAASPNLSWRTRIYLALSFMEMGDQAAASTALNALANEFGERQDDTLRLRVGEDQDDILEATIYSAILAAGTGDPRADELWRYVEANRSRDILLTSHVLLYVGNRLPREEREPAGFTYTLNGETHDESLERGRTLSLILSADDLDGLSVQVTSGKLSALVRREVPLSQAASAPSPDISVRRTYLVNGTPTTTLPASGLVEIRLDFTIGAQAPNGGCYQVTDYLPSGLKPVSSYRFARAVSPPPAAAFVGIPYRIEDQSVSFCVVKGTPPVSYLARPSAPGVYRAEPATIHAQRTPSVINFSSADTVTIAGP